MYVQSMRATSTLQYVFSKCCTLTMFDHMYKFILDGVHAVCDLYALSRGPCIL